MASKEKELILCVKHGKELAKPNFYVANSSSLYSGIGRIPVCKNCISKMFTDYMNAHKDPKIAIYNMCRKLDIAFSNSNYEGAYKECDNDTSRIFGLYMKNHNSLGKTNGVGISFDDGEHLSDDVQDAKQEETSEVAIIGTDLKMTEDDKKAKEDVIRLLEYDPFEGYPESDQKFLYTDIINYFGDEDVVEDQFLVSQIIQVVNNNNHIRKIDHLISQYMADMKTLVENEGRVKSLSSMKKEIVNNTDKIAKENRISVKSRSGSNISKSSLTVMMERLRALDFEDAEIDFYDQKKAYGMQKTAEISIKAIDEQLQFDENDIGYMISEQRSMIKNMENKILDLEEENRKLHVEIESHKKKN